MKDTYFFYSVATLAIGSILVIFVSLAIGTLPTSTPREVRAADAARATTRPQKDCDCCRQMTPQELETSREQLAALRNQRAAYQKATELLKQYGLEKGLRRIKQSHPKIAEQLEDFTEKYTVAREH